MPHRIVINTWGSFGDVYPYIGLGLALRARGHDAVLAMPAYYRATVEREGLGFHAVGPDIDPTDRETMRRIMDPRTGTEFIIKADLAFIAIGFAGAPGINILRASWGTRRPGDFLGSGFGCDLLGGGFRDLLGFGFYGHVR